jgi:CPA2 family monovalent cation:H+ antiporter-2
MPFREVFISFFFISVGSLLNLTFFFDHILFIVLLTAGVIVAKFLLVVLTVRLFKYPPRVMLLAALSLFQVGEFSLLLSTVGLDYGLLPDAVYQYFLAVAILSMGITPFIMGTAGRITDKILALFGLNQVDAQKEDAPSAWSEECKDHIVIVGYGINGENISYAAQKVGIPHIIVDLDPESYRAAQSRHDHVIFGDASDPLILKEVGISEARVLVIAISDPDATHRIISSVRIFSKTVCIIVRTRYVSEIDVNLRLGADIVIPEEFETSIEIFTRVMKKYMIRNDRIRSFITDIRSSDYLMLTDKDRLTSEVSNLGFEIPNQEIITLKVSEEVAHEFQGKTLQEIGLRERFSVTLLAIKREREYITEDLHLAVIQQGDLLYLFGKADDIYQLNDAF